MLAALPKIIFLIYINDIHKSPNLFHFILFADDKTLITKNNIYKTDIINAELAKLSIWFKVNKLSLNISKSFGKKTSTYTINTNRQ